MKTLLTLTAALSMAVSASAAMAAGGSYTGNWKVKLTHDVYVTTNGYTGHGPDTTHCITLTDDGSIGWPHSGFAELDNDRKALEALPELTRQVDALEAELKGLLASTSSR